MNWWQRLRGGAKTKTDKNTPREYPPSPHGKTLADKTRAPDEVANDPTAIKALSDRVYHAWEGCEQAAEVLARIPHEDALRSLIQSMYEHWQKKNELAQKILNAICSQGQAAVLPLFLRLKGHIVWDDSGRKADQADTSCVIDKPACIALVKVLSSPNVTTAPIGELLASTEAGPADFEIAAYLYRQCRTDKVRQSLENPVRQALLTRKSPNAEAALAQLSDRFLSVFYAKAVEAVQKYGVWCIEERDKKDLRSLISSPQTAARDRLVHALKLAAEANVEDLQRVASCNDPTFSVERRRVVGGDADSGNEYQTTATHRIPVDFSVARELARDELSRRGIRSPTDSR